MAEFVSVVSRALTTEEMEINAAYIYNYLSPKGWTVNAIAGMLGNMHAESTINPGRYQGDDPSGAGWGLTQWTPRRKYTDWCEENGLEWSHMDSALKRIEYEMEQGIQFFSTNAYPITFREFKVSEKSPSWLAGAFVRNYERPASVLYDPDKETYEEHLAAMQETTERRGRMADRWYEFLTGMPAPSPNTSSKRLSKLLLYAAGSDLI